MKPSLRKAIPEVGSSFVVRKDIGFNMVNNWHYHAEYELLHIRKSNGTWLIGDYVGHFKSGDVVLLGPFMPHSFIHEEKYIRRKTGIPGEAGVVLFLPEILGSEFFKLPETRGIEKVLQLSKRGLKLQGETREQIVQIMESLPESENCRKLINLLNILQMIAEKPEFEILASAGYMMNVEQASNSRLKQVLEYTFQNYHESITLDDVARIINMGTHSFCRFFKEKTGKTYIRFLMEVRIGQACKLMIEDDLQPSEVCYSCGYNSISHFNHQFKLIKNLSPMVFKKSYFDQLDAIEV